MSDDIHHVDRAALTLAKTLQTLGTGDLAQLRRLDVARPAPAFWRLCGQVEEVGQNETCWIPIVVALAALTPRGDPSSRKDLHDARRSLGLCFCDGGVADWAQGAAPRPMLSEARLARLSNSRGAQRTDRLLRAVRALATSRDPSLGVHVGDLAWAFLNANPNKLNRDYYRKLHSVPMRTAAD